MRQTGCPLPQPQRCLVEERAGAGVFNQNETAIAGKQNTARFVCAGEGREGVSGQDGFGVGEGGWCVRSRKNVVL